MREQKSSPRPTERAGEAALRQNPDNVAFLSGAERAAAHEHSFAGVNSLTPGAGEIPAPRVCILEGRGGWTALRELAGTLIRERSFFRGARAFLKQNKPGGYACVSCAWTKPSKPKVFEICESGAKATAWELTRRTASPQFFERHSLHELEGWPDHDLEKLGRLIHPLKWDAASDRYLPVAWADAFAEIGRGLRGYDPKKIVFYLCGRASLETAYMYQLYGRMVGTNNFPNSSNMCHESTSVGLPKSIGCTVGTVILEDFEKTDCIFFFGQNTGTNSPRFLNPLKDASRRGVPIIIFNPIREPGFERIVHEFELEPSDGGDSRYVNVATPRGTRQ